MESINYRDAKIKNKSPRHVVATITRYVVIEAVRNRLFGLMLIGVTGVFALGEFIGGLAITETSAIQGSAVAFVLRFAAVFLLSLYVITGVIREFNERSIEMLLALPAPRYVYYAGKLCGYLLLALIMAGVACLPLFLYAGPGQVMLWSFSLFCELAIVTALCLFFLFTLGQVTAVFCAVAAFYFLARSMASMQLISHSAILASGSIAQAIMQQVLDLIAVFLPQLDGFTQTDWLVYGGGMQQIPAIVAQTVIYVGLLSAAALFDLYRRNF